MKSVFAFVLISFVFCAVAAIAADLDHNGRKYQVADGRYPGILTGKQVDFAKTQADTFYIYGGPDRDDGKFQFPDGSPEPLNQPGYWSSIDLTQRTEINWHIDTYHCQNLDPNTVPNHAWWCGDTWPDDCDTGDFNGYGNAWIEQIDFSAAVPNPALSTTVTVNAMLNYDNEPGFDFLYLEYNSEAGMVQHATYNGAMDSVVVSESFTVTPPDYTGGGNDEVLVRWRFQSDGGWSDEDCLYPTQGAAQVDNIQILFDQGSGDVEMSFEDNEGAMNDWEVTFPIGVGDFAKVWPLLNDIDACRSNGTPLVAFIDDGVVVPGTGGYLCTTWCYGPNGYIVNPEGGLAGPEAHIHNHIWSPILDWPGEEYSGAALEFDVFHHEDLDENSAGIFYVWYLRSADQNAGQDILEAGWLDREFVNWLPCVWRRIDRYSSYIYGGIVTDMLVQGRTQVQLAFGIYELGWFWGSESTDGTPSPYFDNIAFLTWEFRGPGMAAREIDIAQDNFPAIGDIDYEDLAANSIRFDMARDISLTTEPVNRPGDSIFCDVAAVRAGSVLNDLPKMYYKLFPNPVFDSIRTNPVPNEGFVYGDTTRTALGSVVEDRYNFDLPDTGFFFPGDVIHYYFEGQDNLAGDIGTTLLPGDTTGFSGPPLWPNFNSLFRVQGLPTLFSEIENDQPQILFWNDFADRGGENEWYYALYNGGAMPGRDFDVYYTNGPSSGVGNGLGGRATSAQIKGYDTILYTCGDLGTYTISNGDFQNDPGNDVGLLDTWLRLGGKNMFLTGDDLVYDLWTNSGSATQAFVNNWIGVQLVDRDLRPLLDNQSAPTVVPIPGNSMYLSTESWIAYGGCLGFNRFDAVLTAGLTEKVAEFLDPNGATGRYPYPAMTCAHDTEFDATIVYLPYDLMFIYTTTPHPAAPMSSRARLLHDVLNFFGYHYPTFPGGVPDAGVFSVRNYPNPFNPSTKIEFFMPRRGELSIKIFNVRGELVRTLVSEVREAGAGFVVWDGSNDRGSGVASGVYFYETRAMGETSVHKMALVK